MNLEPLPPYPLPEHVRTGLLTLARNSDLLVFGETHGTQEAPRLILGLLPDLRSLGYGALALEIAAGERDQLIAWTHGEAKPPPIFGPAEFRDGRGNIQTLSLIKSAVEIGLQIICFDVNSTAHDSVWSDRDRGMADNLLDQWQRHAPDGKVMGICGNFHSRLATPIEYADLWPSFAYSVQQARPDLAVSTIAINFGSGHFFNGELREFNAGGKPTVETVEWRPPGWLGHTADLYLPHATAVTFLDA